MFYFELYDDIRLQNLKHFKKVDVVNKAVKLYRKDKPLNLRKVVLSIFTICLIPALIFYFIFGVSLAVGWLSLSVFTLNIKAANNETPEVKPYLDQVID